MMKNDIGAWIGLLTILSLLVILLKPMKNRFILSRFQSMDNWILRLILSLWLVFRLGEIINPDRVEMYSLGEDFALLCLVVFFIFTLDEKKLKVEVSWWESDEEQVIAIPSDRYTQVKEGIWCRYYGGGKLSEMEKVLEEDIEEHLTGDRTGVFFRMRKGARIRGIAYEDEVKVLMGAGSAIVGKDQEVKGGEMGMVGGRESICVEAVENCFGMLIFNGD